MTYLLEDLVIDRVDLVDEGANSEAFIELFKRKELEKPMDYVEVIAKLDPEQGELIQAAIDKLAEEIIKVKEELATTEAERDELAKQVETMNTEEAPKEDEEEDNVDKLPFDEKETLKSMPQEIRDVFNKMKDQKEAAEEALRKAKEQELHTEAVNKAATMKSLPIEQDKLVDIVKTASPEILELLADASKVIGETALNEIGKNQGFEVGSTSNDVWAQIEQKAEEVVKAKSVTKAKAISIVVDENPDLYKQYLQGGAN